MNTNDFYDKKFLWDTLFLIETQINDLSMWSVYNNDILCEQVHQLEKQAELIKKALIEMDKNGELPEKGGDENNE